MGTAPIVELARAYGLHPRLWLLFESDAIEFFSVNFVHCVSQVFLNGKISFF